MTTTARPITEVNLDKNHHGLPYRTPNKTGHGSHRFTAHANVELPAPHAGYRAAIYQDSWACNAETVTVTLYHKGRMMPEAQLKAVRAAVVAAYIAAFGHLELRQEHETPAIKLAAKSAPEVIDCTPTWQALIPAFVAMIENGSASSRAFAIEELTRLAAFADSDIARRKATLGGQTADLTPAI